jgi:hypothetical protein
MLSPQSRQAFSSIIFPFTNNYKYKKSDTNVF